MKTSTDELSLAMVKRQLRGAIYFDKVILRLLTKSKCCLLLVDLLTLCSPTRSSLSVPLHPPPQAPLDHPRDLQHISTSPTPFLLPAPLLRRIHRTGMGRQMGYWMEQKPVRDVG